MCGLCITSKRLLNKTTRPRWIAKRKTKERQGKGREEQKKERGGKRKGKDRDSGERKGNGQGKIGERTVVEFVLVSFFGEPIETYIIDPRDWDGQRDGRRDCWVLAALGPSRFVCVSVYLLLKSHANPIDAQPFFGNENDSADPLVSSV